MISAETAHQLPGVFNTLEPALSKYGYLAVGGVLFLEDFGVAIMVVATIGVAIWLPARARDDAAVAPEFDDVEPLGLEPGAGVPVLT